MGVFHIPQAEYNCTQAEFYEICTILLANYRANQAALQAFKGKYTPTWGDDFEAAITAAQALPSDEERGELSETLRLEMIPLNKTCCNNWQDLKRYIAEAFSKDIQKPKLEAAGSLYYEKAADFNWEQAKAMHLDAMQFMTDHSAELDMGGLNMPAGFPGQYLTDYNAWNDKYDLFMPARQTKVATMNKVTANNAVYKDYAMVLCSDGQAKFRNSAAEAQFFVWETIREMVSPPSSASLKVTVSFDELDAPAVGAEVAIKKKGTNALSTATVGVDGSVTFGSIDPAVYLWSVSLAGRQTQSGEKDVNKGTGARLTVRLPLV
ncbi:MAG: carboxypeptidase regulatory-like domain-containing protein [Bacteroidetes bacterium]|nr:carboxypeptidase regulatory-like domain-containing protein [Bacteroidota bacterium]